MTCNQHQLPPPSIHTFSFRCWYARLVWTPLLWLLSLRTLTWPPQAPHCTTAGRREARVMRSTDNQGKSLVCRFDCIIYLLARVAHALLNCCGGSGAVFSRGAELHFAKKLRRATCIVQCPVAAAPAASLFHLARPGLTLVVACESTCRVVLRLCGLNRFLPRFALPRSDFSESGRLSGACSSLFSRVSLSSNPPAPLYSPRNAYLLNFSPLHTILVCLLRTS